jgi:hypothetical protein
MAGGAPSETMLGPKVRVTAPEGPRPDNYTESASQVLRLFAFHRRGSEYRIPRIATRVG